MDDGVAVYGGIADAEDMSKSTHVQEADQILRDTSACIMSDAEVAAEIQELQTSLDDMLARVNAFLDR